ncbi:MAG: hypothetical protein HZC38_02470 [Chloroflexi bacterium]|nr:hypothetical protein [Chloroflexota bacterium]
MSFLKPFASLGFSEVDKNAELAIYLLNHLKELRSPIDLIWRGDRHIRTLQFTSHVLEALHHLNLKGVTSSLLEPATAWLIDLPFGRDTSSDELRALRLYPSRFKTLALVNMFDPNRLMEDFTELSDLFDPTSGWIVNAPFAELSPTLLTMIWLDVLLLIEPHGYVSSDLKIKQKRASQMLLLAFERWEEKARTAMEENKNLPDNLGYQTAYFSEIANSGDASYALDILLRLGSVAPDSRLVEEARRILTFVVRNRRLGDLRRSDFVYANLHLAMYFPRQPETHEVVELFIASSRGRYETLDCQREPISFHALILRLLAAHHKQQLPESITGRLWANNIALGETLELNERERVEHEFAELIRHTVHIQLAPPQRISGTRTRGEVYRMQFGLKTDAADEDGNRLSVPRGSLRLIVKKGPFSVLEQACERYRDLREPLQKLFARHSSAVEGSNQSVGYLIMQDLADMRPLSEVLSEIDGSHTSRREQQQKSELIAMTIARLLNSLHNNERQDVSSHHTSHLTDMLGCITKLCQPTAFPELKQWLEGTIEVNGWTYKPLSWYLKKLSKHEQRLHPPSLGYAHCDCHSRNLMLNRDFSSAMFVDIDTLTSTEDYISDYGVLIEDVALYQSLPYGDEEGRLEWEDIQTARSAAIANTLDNWIAYPAFPQHAESIVAFQRKLLETLADYAAKDNDDHWKERLWLSVARGLLLLANRQLISHTVEPRRRSNDIRMVNDTLVVQISYAEATRLLHELYEYLERKSDLPELPFPGEHRPPPLRPESPEPSVVGTLMHAIGNELGKNVERQAVTDAPYYIDYFIQPSRRLFARIHTKSSAPMLYLSCRVDQLDDPKRLAQLTEEGDFKICVALTSLASVPDVLALVRQAYQVAIFE